ncbi:hypothetical protein [Streptomyces sp. XH2]|uniref:hypothetical protein n=1 Tax=Streptomyces sp. XH2 TaxID=3412483 RepID=UPI003C7E1FAF
MTGAVRVRAGIVVAASLLMASFAARTARGHSRSHLRLRLSSAAMAVAIAAIVALPGTFPAWLKAEQAACGVLLLGVVLAVNGKQMRSAFTEPGRRRPPLPGCWISHAWKLRSRAPQRVRPPRRVHRQPRQQPRATLQPARQRRAPTPRHLPNQAPYLLNVSGIRRRADSSPANVSRTVGW